MNNPSEAKLDPFLEGQMKELLKNSEWLNKVIKQNDFSYEEDQRYISIDRLYAEIHNLDPYFYSQFLYKIGTPHIGFMEKLACEMRTLKEMKEFYHGHIFLFYSGGNTLKESIHKVKCNIGSALREEKASFWKRMKWFIFFGIRKSNHYYV